MHALRTATTLARLVLAWFVLTVGVAVAAPAFDTASMQLVCSAGAGAKLLLVDEDGQTSTAPSHHSLQCPMCLPAVLPTQAPDLRWDVPQPLGVALQPRVAAHLAALAGAPLPPRGPPAHG